MRPFLLITILAALIIAGTAALFSVTGISSVFAGHYFQVAIMAGALETGKIIISSILYRYWGIMNRYIKSYMLVALLVLMIITSAGIFGYLSEAYQKTKSGYDIAGKEVELLTSKKQLFQNEYDRYEKRLNTLTDIRSGQETRLDSLYSRGQTTSARRIETSIKNQDVEIANLNKQLLLMSDSISAIETKILERQTTIIGGDLGPLQYVATAFNTDMDTVVKFFILILIFVFDPLAVTLIVAANMIFVNKHYEREEWTGIFNKDKKVDRKQHNDLNDNSHKPILTEEDRQQTKEYKRYMYENSNEKKMWDEAEKEMNKIVEEELFKDIPVHNEEKLIETSPVDPDVMMIKTKSVIDDFKDNISEVNKDEPKQQVKPIKKWKWKSANFIDPNE